LEWTKFFKMSPGGNARSLLVLVVGILVVLAPKQADAGLASYGICQAGCASIVTACYTGAGAVFGTVTAEVGTPAAIIGCNSAFGKCQAACIAAGLAPIP